MSDFQRSISPVDGSITSERPYASADQIEAVLTRARSAQAAWRATRLAERIAICSRFGEILLQQCDVLAVELAWIMGRPVSQTPGEIRTCVERARTMIAYAEEAMADIIPTARDGFERFIQRTPLGVVYCIAPWNYPYLTTVNTLIPALLAGNAVVLKHAPQTQVVAERFGEALQAAGLPEGVFQLLHLRDAEASAVAADARVDHVAFTGSVRTGRAVQQAVSHRFIGVGLELGGKDPAYVRHDANLTHAVENLVDGAFFNSGQSCCGIERIYVHERLYDDFVAAAIEATGTYRLGNPIRAETNIGPVVRQSSADFIRGQLDEAKSQGAEAHSRASGDEGPATPYIRPRILTGVSHSMRVMREETFGPLVGVMKVSGDEEAVELMNDSDFGLTAAIWTSDLDAARSIGGRLETGTVFMNRCDHLDPQLAWTGVKDSGRGCTLSVLGFDALTRPKSFHLRHQI
jgi:acyl-CoA reductase-like NAD-dependent aldehyde dehydrogenase